MSLPNMSGAIMRKSQKVNLKTITPQIVNYESVNVESAPVEIDATIQAIEKNQIKKAKVDYNLDYISIHTTVELEMSYVIEYKNKNYRIFWTKDLSEYGFFHAQGEEIK